MRWFRRRRPPDPNSEQRARQEAILGALEAGGLPPPVEARLDRQRSGALPWTSTLAVPGFAAARHLALRPVGQVMGSAVVRPSWSSQWVYGAWQNGEIVPLTRALTGARDLAVERLRAEADRLGAHGVVAVTVTETRPDWGNGVIVFQLTGTAVVFEGQPRPPQLFLGNISATDAYRLFAAGYVPLTVVAASTAYYIMTTASAAWTEASWANQEVTDLSRGIYAARDAVVVRMRQQAREVGADGVLGARWSMAVDEVEVERPAVDTWGPYGVTATFTDHILHLTVVGTAIGRFAGAGAPPPVEPLLPLRDPAPTDLRP
ncbi:MAG: heavy metal-binding domain-containing protein [Actinomycetia bacterium]|nr:heavy metal-binding domain-containing protein [Actinomycetes bacterium]